MKGFFRSKPLCFFIEAASVLFGIVAVILYICFGKNEFNKDLALSAIIPAIIAFILEIVTFFYTIQPLNDIAFLLVLYSFLSYIGSQANYIANVFTSIDGSTFSSSFIITILFFLISLGAALISVFLPKTRNKEEVKIITEKRV